MGNAKGKYEFQDTGSNTDERHQLNKKLRQLPIHGRTESQLPEEISPRKKTQMVRVFGVFIKKYFSKKF